MGRGVVCASCSDLKLPHAQEKQAIIIAAAQLRHLFRGSTLEPNVLVCDEVAQRAQPKVRVRND
jgi:hypothetical protein